MSGFVNQHSFVLIGVVVLGALWLVARRLRRLKWVALLAIVVLLGAFAAFLRTGTSDVASSTELDRVLARGKPVALEFYSNY